MWRYVHTDELYHYGIPGMKWGVRNTKAYRSARSAYKKARKAHFKAEVNKFVRKGVDSQLTRASDYRPKSGAKLMGSYKNANKTYTNKVVTKANMKAIAKSKTNKLGYNKAEFKTYAKGLYKSGIPNSSRDRASQGKGTTLYNTIARKKGKTYANNVLKKASKKACNAFVASTAVGVGIIVARRYVNED